MLLRSLVLGTVLLVAAAAQAGVSGTVAGFDSEGSALTAGSSWLDELGIRHSLEDVRRGSGLTLSLDASDSFVAEAAPPRTIMDAYDDAPLPPLKAAIAPDFGALGLVFAAVFVLAALALHRHRYPAAIHVLPWGGPTPVHGDPRSRGTPIQSQEPLLVLLTDRDIAQLNHRGLVYEEVRVPRLVDGSCDVDSGLRRIGPG